MLRSIYRAILIRQNRRNLERNAVLGTDIRIETSTSCLNTSQKENVMIGNHGCMFGCIQAQGGSVQIGNDFYIGSHTHIQALESIRIGNSVIISSDVMIVDNNNHPTDPLLRLEMSQCEDYMTDEKWEWKYSDSKPIVIEDNTWIGRNSMIMKGCTIGVGSIVAAGAVVTHDVPPYCVVAGNPAKVVKKVEHIESGDVIEQN